MRILHVISAPAAGGAEVYVKQLTIELRRQGHDPLVAFVGHATDDGRSATFERAFLDELQANGVDYFFIGAESRRRPWLGCLRMLRFCRSNATQVYHSHLKRGVIFGALLRIPRIHTHHNSIAESPRWAYKVYNHLIDQYVGISTSCATRLRRFSGREVTPIRNGIDVSRYPGRLRELAPGARVQCISVGRLFPQKNYPGLVRAIALLPDRVRYRIRLSIAGEGPPEVMSELAALIHDAGLSGQMQLLGNRPNIRDLLDRADLFVMSSAWEGFPIALLEATASGLPFVATDVGGCRELAELCGNGVIVPPADPQALADAIAALANDPGRLATLSRSAMASAPQLCIGRAAAEHVRLYESLVGKEGPGR